jgi:Rps23 Pro-64 3,4-dihydroxylase Tpa1-like proline 4-hydroxylase
MPANSRASRSTSSDKLLATWLAPKYRDARKLRAQYLKASPYPHAAFARFLLPAKAAAVREAMLAQQYTPKESDLFKMNETGELRGSSNETLRALCSFLFSPEFSEWLSTLTGIKLTNKDIDVSGSRYDDTGFLLCHDDRVTGRKLAYILYLSADFTPADGGALVLFTDKNGRPGRVVKRYYPKYNSFSLFTVSAKSWHAVEEITGSKSRLSVHGWFH